MTTIKNIKSLLVLAAIALLPMASFAQAFEGVVEMTISNTSAGETSSIKWLVKNGNSKMIINTSTKGTNVQYTLILKQGGDAQLIMGDGITNVPASQLANKSLAQVGQTAIAKGSGEKTVAGYPCTAVINSRGQIAAWVSEKTNLTINDLPETLRSQGMINILNALGIKGIPLEIIGYDEKGEQVYNQTITSIKTTSVSDNEFDTSKYRKMEEVLSELNPSK